MRIVRRGIERYHEAVQWAARDVALYGHGLVLEAAQGPVAVIVPAIEFERLTRIEAAAVKASRRGRLAR